VERPIARQNLGPFGEAVVKNKINVFEFEDRARERGVGPRLVNTFGKHRLQYILNQ
jgi:hypothetical protein